MQGYAVVVLAGLVTLARGQGAAKVDQSQILKDIANKFTAQLPVDIRCKTDPTNKLSCGVNFRQECEEKWNFKSPCTPENLARNLTIFPHPHAKNKFLMCGDFGKLYVVLCPRYEVYHEGCRQCVAKGSKLTATCGTHDIPLSESTASNPCTHEAIASGKLFFPFPNDLGKYLHCDAWGKAWEMICTPGEVWNQNQLACVNPALMNPCFQSFRNPGLLYRHPCDPHKYIRCDSESIPYEVPCQVGDIFSEANQVCQSASMYKVKPKNICGNYRFRFRSYAHSTFSIDPTKQLANLEGQQTGTLSPSGSLNPGGEINTLVGAWKDTVNPSPGASIGAADLAIDLGTIDGTAAGGAGFAVSDSTGQSMTADSGWQASIDSLTSIRGSASQDTTSVLSSSGSLGTNTATEFSSTGGSDIISPPSVGFAGQGAGSEFFASTVGDTIISSNAGSEPGKKILSASGSLNSGKILSSTKTSGSVFPSTAGIVGQDLTASSTGDVFSTGGFSGIVTGADAGLGTELTGGTMSSGSSAGRLSTGANVKSTGSLNIVGDFSSTSDQATHIINSAITEVASVDAGLQSAKKSGRFDLSGSVTTNSAHISGRLDPALSGTTGVQSFELGGQLISKSVPVESRGAETGMGGFAVVDPINSGVVDPAGIGKVGLSAADQSSKTIYTTVDASFTGGTVGASSMSSGVSSDGHADTSAISGNTLTIVGDSSLPADTVVLDLTGTSSQGNAAADGFTGIESLAKTMVGLIDSSQPIPGVDFASSASTSSAGEGPIVDAGAALGQTDVSGPVATKHIGAVAAGTGTESTFSVAGSSLDSTAANTIGSPSLGAAAVEGAVTGTIYNGIPGGANTGSMDVFFNSAGIAEGMGAASTGGTFRGSANTATTSLDSASTGSVDSRIFDQAASIDRAAFSSMVDSLIGQGTVADSVSALLGSPGSGTATLQSADTGSTSAVTFDSSATGALLDSLVHSIGANTRGSASFDSTGQTGTGSVNAVKGDMGAIALDQVGAGPGLQSTIINVGAGTGIESNLLGAGARAIIKDQTTSFASDSTGGGSGSIAQSFGYVTTGTSSAGASASHPDNTANIVGTGRALIHGGTETSGAARRDIDLGIVGTQVLKTDGSHVAVTRIGGTNGADTGGVGSKASSQSSSRVNPIDTPGARKVLLKEYVYSEIKNAEPCTAVNRKWNRTHFRLRANPKSFIQCDSQGNMYVRKCGDNLYFDYFTASCSHNKPVDGVIVK